MHTETIAIGSELLNAGRVDTNSVWIGERLAGLGIDLCLKTCVGDDADTLRACLTDALGRLVCSRADGRPGRGLIITTGGLGPTFDDRTKEIFADVLGVPMLEDADTRSRIDAFFRARGRRTTENNYKQALIPQGAMALHNPLGTAPGVYWENPPGYPNCRIVMLPGVPKEMMAIWTADVQPRLSGLGKECPKTLRFVVGGVGESVLDEMVGAIRERHPQPDWTILAPRTHVEFLVRSNNAEELSAVRAEMEGTLGDSLVCVGAGSPESVLLDLLTARGETLALAESVTGGVLASRLAGVPGASRAFLGGAVVYTPVAKAELVGVPPDFIAAHGTVGEAITRELAARIRERLGATWGLAITGNAGPTVDENALGDMGDKEIGTCFIALAGPDCADCRRHSIHGDRLDVQLRATNWAIDMLRRRLL